MCGEVEVSKCKMCGKVGPVKRKYYHYDIKCDCHSPNHFEIVHHCKDCTPKPPFETRVTFSLSRLKPRED